MIQILGKGKVDDADNTDNNANSPPQGFAVHRTEEDPISWGRSDPVKGTQLQRFDPAQQQTTNDQHNQSTNIRQKTKANAKMVRFFGDPSRS